MAISRNSSRPGLGLATATAMAIAATLVVNTLSNLYPPGGQNVGEIANTVLSGVLITPANYAFAIWGVIYLGLIAYAIYQFHPARRQNPQIQRVNKLLIMACVAQVIWIFLFTLQRFAWSVVAMLVILLALIAVYLTLDIGLQRVTSQQRWRVHIPFSIYLGWIAVATIVNVASAFYAAEWGGWGLSPVAWTVMMIGVAAMLAAIVIAQRADLAFTLVFIWAFVAIALRHTDVPAIWGTAVLSSLALCAGLGWVKTRSV
ncbi:MAG: tryptophan-rich sensory protein [Leptolyngbyaceae cyanobacterium SM2_5_2]|nr:tryptophan-rich sensory protein [Leptolyngbyaceae cyanobacterium SM2_5_2]